jgi:very-short-patch-repair endonuclease
MKALKIEVMKRKRHYRGGYKVAGLTEFARELRKQQTSAEDLLWQLLRDRRLLGFKFRRQHQIGDYIADFFCREANLVIECDGAIHDRNEAWHHDQNRDAYMINQGLRILRIANERILNDTENVLLDIQQDLHSPSGIGAGGG